MREVTRVRFLKFDEVAEAMRVYRFTVRYAEIAISDALGYADREFTVPTSLPLTDRFNITGFEPDAKWVIHAGDAFYGFLKSSYNRTVLIHELMHVWQGLRSSEPWHVAAKSGMAQLTSIDAYDYDEHQWLKWRMYNPEQQAQIVQHWYYRNMQTSDPRYNYIKKYIWGETVPQEWLDSLVYPVLVGKPLPPM
jgi:hypothetical protein